MNVDGLSEASLHKMMNKGLLNELYDLFTLKDHMEEIIEMEGFGEKSFHNLVDAVERARKVTLPKFLYSLGIANVGLSNAKLICRYFEDDLDAIRNADADDFTVIDGIGPVIGDAVSGYFRLENNRQTVDGLLQYVEIEKKQPEKTEKILDGKTFVITGSLEHYENRKQLQEQIELLGGKATGSVTKKTDYLINNNKNSTSSKNKKAMELSIPIITEEEFMDMIK